MKNQPVYVGSRLSGLMRCSVITTLTTLLLILGGCGSNGAPVNSPQPSPPPTDDPSPPGSTPIPTPTPSPTPLSGPTPRLLNCSNILPVGDSITLGVNGGYRNDLYTGLQQNNCGVSYVGTLFDPNTRVADKHHEGHAGFNIDNISAYINSWSASQQPNIILLMIGTNDIAWWTAKSANQIAASHNALIDQFEAASPDAWIFVASLPPETSTIIQPNNIDRAVLVQQVNIVIRTNVESRVAQGQRVRFVDVNSVLTAADLYDGIHPTEAAHAKIAAKFLEEIRFALSSQ